ncbi:MAG: UvrD-helicase domain-containing protein [Candidatus Firestonebacteria bacterium]
MHSTSSIFDITKNVVVSAPAGSGKTEKLARRYIALLSAGVGPERILALTFTEKAAVEMKERILGILKSEKPELYKNIREKIFLMRISTIHSFCLSLLKRFAFELDLDPNFEIVDLKDSGLIDAVLSSSFTGIIESEKEKGKEDLKILRKYLVDLSSKYGWSKLKEIVEKFFLLRPATLVGRPELLDVSNFKKAHFAAVTAVKEHVYFAEHYKEMMAEDSPENIVYAIDSVKDLLLTTAGTPRKQIQKGINLEISKEEYAAINGKIFDLYNEAKKYIYNKELLMFYEIFVFSNNEYTGKKKELNVLDFNDLEYITYDLLNNHAEVDNILYAFDEQTDHIFVDEFQDTNYLQWSIINKLTEEWRSGLGSKRDKGIIPTLFIVGDEKQSIFGFRSANVEVFNTAAVEMKKWYGSGFIYEQVNENYRSGKDIVAFVNKVFSQIMARKQFDPKWKTKYMSFNPIRDITGRVEILQINKGEKDNKEEAKKAAERIKELVGKENIYVKGRGNKEVSEKIKKGDIAVLLRKRTHLADFEEAFTKAKIDYVVVNGLGFYQQPEIIILRSLLFTLLEPSDDYNLYLLLKSRFFSLKEEEIIDLVSKEGRTLYDKIADDKKLGIIRDYSSRINVTPMNQVLESFMESAKGWKIFWEPQRSANIKKFIEIVQELETKGSSLQEIRAYFEERMDTDEEPKANLSTEDMDAVKIMTVHTAKGLEFPVVFFVRMGEEVRKDGEYIRINERKDRTGILYCPDKGIRGKVSEFIDLKMKEEEEEKRIFYVAVTRARDRLVLSGVRDEKNRGFWKYLV